MSDNKSRTEPLLPEELVEKWREQAKMYGERFDECSKRKEHVIAAQQGALEAGFKACAAQLEGVLQASFRPCPGLLSPERCVLDIGHHGSCQPALRVQPPQASDQSTYLQGRIDEAQWFADRIPPRYHAETRVGALRAGEPTDRNAPSEPNLLHLADLAQANAIEQCAVEAGERSPEGVSSHTMLGDMWDRRIRNLRAAKPGNAASSELQDCDLCHMSPMITEQENGYHVSKITGSRFKCVANSAKPGNVAPTATPAQDKAKK